MNKKLLVLALCIAVLAVSALAVSESTKQSQSVQPSQTQSDAVPDHVLYRMLLHDIILRRKAAEEADRQGRHDAAMAWRMTYKDKFNLSDQQALIFDQIADECEEEVKRQDARARVIINRDRARYPNNEVPRGQKIQPPSPELKVMQEERNAIILRARDRLHALLGNQEFARIDAAIRRFVAPNITITRPAPPSNSSQPQQQ